MRELTGMRANGWLVACLSTIAMVTFIPALQLTSVANVAIIIAAQPFVAAGLAWIWFRERARLRTLLACLAASLCALGWLGCRQALPDWPRVDPGLAVQAWKLA